MHHLWWACVALTIAAARGDDSRLFFLHIPKTAGTTIEGIIGRKEFPSRAANVTVRRCTSASWHTPPRDIAPEFYPRDRTFCVVRDPLDRRGGLDARHLAPTC
jgi:hypothetical protein